MDAQTSIQRHLDRLQELANKDLMKQKTNECYIMLLGWANPLQHYRQGTGRLRRNSAGKVLAYHMLSMNKQHVVPEINGILGYMNKIPDSKLREVTNPLHSVCIRPHLE